MTIEAVIGLEVHLQVRTASKAFCGCSPRFGAPPNTHLCPVCMGLPGTLPVLNAALVDAAVRLALAVGSTIAPVSRFARKNYFYPDLPKGYQITQAAEPIASAGELILDRDGEEERRIAIAHIHMEEDAGRSIHDGDRVTLIDLNRAGVPLMEIVSEPDIRSAADAADYLRSLRAILQSPGDRFVVATEPSRSSLAPVGKLVDMVEQKHLRHRGDSELRLALRGARQRPMGDSWAWSRKSSQVNIPPLVLCSTSPASTRA